MAREPQTDRWTERHSEPYVEILLSVELCPPRTRSPHPQSLEHFGDRVLAEGIGLQSNDIRAGPNL